MFCVISRSHQKVILMSLLCVSARIVVIAGPRDLPKFIGRGSLGSHGSHDRDTMRKICEGHVGSPGAPFCRSLNEPLRHALNLACYYFRIPKNPISALVLVFRPIQIRYCLYVFALVTEDNGLDNQAGPTSSDLNPSNHPYCGSASIRNYKTFNLLY